MGVVKLKNRTATNMTPLASIRSDGTLDANELSSEFNLIYQNIEANVNSNQNLNQCKDDVISLSKQLTSVSNLLSRFDQELYSTKIDLLLKKITTKQLASAKEDRRSRWKSMGLQPKKHTGALTSGRKVVPASAAQIAIDSKPEIKDTDIKYQISNKSYQNLNNCRLTWTGDDILNEYATLQIQDVKKSSIYFNIVPFNQGSLLLERFQDTCITIITPENSNLQLRLHKMDNCKLYIRRRAGSQVQDVVIEDFSHCVFHEDTKSYVRIHNFNQLTYQNKESNDGYTFVNFEVENP